MIITIPVSVGELFDKISILEIKLNNIKDVSKINNIKKEYNYLCEIALNLDQNFQESSLYKMLYEINNNLWVVEDSKRAHEANKDFGEKFIYWAREVYLKNDERARIKRQINVQFGSDIVEEKSYKDV